jgi:hypothetical protein
VFKGLLCGQIRKVIYILGICCCLFVVTGCGSDGAGITGYQDYPAGTETVRLSWTAPSTNADGTQLTDLDGYVIYFRTTGDYSHTYAMDVGNVTSAVIDRLSSGAWCFTVTAYNNSGKESEFSNYACKVI